MLEVLACGSPAGCIRIGDVEGLSVLAVASTVASTHSRVRVKTSERASFMANASYRNNS